VKHHRPRSARFTLPSFGLLLALSAQAQQAPSVESLTPSAETSAEEPLISSFPSLPAQVELDAVDTTQKPEAKLPAINGKPKIAILDALCSQDGTARPDLGRLLSDSLNNQLLRQGSCEVIDASQIQAGSVSQGAPFAFTGTASQIGRSLGADYVILPSGVAIGRGGQLSFKKIAVASGKVEQILQSPLPLGAESILPEAEKLATQLFPAPKPIIRSMANERLRNELAIELQTKHLQAAKASQQKEIESAPKAMRLPTAQSEPTLQSLGKITRLLPQWSCCEIHCPQGTNSLQEGDYITVHAQPRGQSGSTAFRLRVARVAEQTIVADLPTDTRQASLVTAGNATYFWQVLSPIETVR
jgi:hypothetical protein